MPYLQEVIQKLEAGSWTRHLKLILTILALLGLVLGYNWRSFRNFGNQEAMDTAQLARNLAQGKGYTTQFIRPLSLYLVKQRSAANGGDPRDPALLTDNHPDLANPPVYPVALAAVFKVLRPNWTINPNKSFWSYRGQFLRYKGDFIIALFNEMIFFAVIVLTFLLARRLFDPAVAWLSGFLLLGCETLWRFSVSGLSTMLVMLIFVGLAWCLVLLEQELREPSPKGRKTTLLTAGLGLLLGLGMLTRYSFGWLILPVVAYLLIFGGPRKAALSLLTVTVFVLVVSPWIYRNIKLCGLPFGTASYSVVEGAFGFSEHRLARAMTPDFNQYFFATLFPKLFANGRAILQNDLPRLGGSWLSALFLAGLLLGFRNPAIRRLRYFVMMSLGTLVVVQALGHTPLSDDSPELNSENLLVLLVPFVFVFGVALFYLMLDQMNLMFLGLRHIIVGLFGFLMVLPMLFTFLPPRSSPVIYPPYNPPLIQRVSGWMKESELMMSDIPWAVAWYGDRQCAWLTLDANDSFFGINDMLKPVRGLYLTPLTLDAPFATQWIKPGAKGWGFLLLDSLMLRRTIPPNFPLREAAPNFLPDHLFLTDHVRWLPDNAPGAPTANPAATEKPASATPPAK